MTHDVLLSVKCLGKKGNSSCTDPPGTPRFHVHARSISRDTHKRASTKRHFPWRVLNPIDLRRSSEKVSFNAFSCFPNTMVDASLSTSTTLQFLTPNHAHQSSNSAAPSSASAASSNSSVSSNEEQPSASQPQQRRRGRGLSLSIGEVVSSAAARNKRHSTGSQNPITTSSPPLAAAPCNQKPNELFIEVEGGQQMIVRPNRIIRGTPYPLFPAEDGKKKG